MVDLSNTSTNRSWFNGWYVCRNILLGSWAKPNIRLRDMAGKPLCLNAPFVMYLLPSCNSPTVWSQLMPYIFSHNVPAGWDKVAKSLASFQ